MKNYRFDVGIVSQKKLRNLGWDQRWEVKQNLLVEMGVVSQVSDFVKSIVNINLQLL